MPPSTQAPFDQGNLLHHPSDIGWHDRKPYERRVIEWRDIARVYEMTLIYEGNRRGRSAAYTVWADAETGHAFPVFMTDVGNLLIHGVQPGGIVSGRWRVRKRGQNYGLGLIP